MGGRGQVPKAFQARAKHHCFRPGSSRSVFGKAGGRSTGMTTPDITNGKEYQLQPIGTDQRLIIAEVSRLIFGVKSITNLLEAQGKFPNPLTLSPTIKVSIKQSEGLGGI